MAELHEERSMLAAATLDMKRAIDSMREELEAVDWYRQRMETAADPELRAILEHHQREEVEHFSMLLEWCRRRDADFAAQLRAYLFTDRPIVESEAVESRALDAPERNERARDPKRATVGSLKPQEPR